MNIFLGYLRGILYSFCLITWPHSGALLGYFGLFGCPSIHCIQSLPLSFLLCPSIANHILFLTWRCSLQLLEWLFHWACFLVFWSEKFFDLGNLSILLYHKLAQAISGLHCNFIPSNLACPTWLTTSFPIWIEIISWDLLFKKIIAVF